MISANKGEWSELYALLKMLGDKKIHAGDGYLNKLEAYYPIIAILRNELDRHQEYTYDKDIVIVAENQKEFVRISTDEFLTTAKTLLKEIQHGGEGLGAFEVPWLTDFLNKIHCERIKAKAQDKADIHVVIHDYHTGMTPQLGFSIKSEVGAAPTLLNPSNATRFVYKITEKEMTPDVVQTVNAINSKGKTMERIKYLTENGYSLEFNQIPHSVFRRNLQMIDSNLPAIIGWMLIDAYNEKNTDLLQVISRSRTLNPMRYEIEDGHDFYGYKVKSTLIAIALGMLPAKPWNGRYDATGGYIVVKEDGDIVCFHLYDRNMLEDYLLNNTRFITPSTSRYDFGYVYQKDADYYFDLVMQIRFK